MQVENLSLAKKLLQYVANSKAISPNDFWLYRLLELNEFSSVKQYFQPVDHNLFKNQSEDCVGNRMESLLKNTSMQHGVLYPNQHGGLDLYPYRNWGNILTCGLFFKSQTIATSKIKRIAAMADNVETQKIGSCEMLSAFAFRSLKNIDTDLHVEIVSMIHYDHLFLLIGRNPTSQLNDPKTWNKESVICDPHNRVVYPVSEYIKIMRLLIDNKSIAYMLIDNGNLGCFHVFSNKAEVNLQYESGINNSKLNVKKRL